MSDKKTITLTADQAAVVRWLCMQYAMGSKNGAVGVPNMLVAERIEAALVVAGKLSS